MRNRRVSGLWLGWRLVAACAALVMAMALPVRADELEVRFPVPPPPFGIIYQYFSRVLDLALSKTAAQHGPYRLVPVEMVASNPRLNALLEAGGDINVLLVSPNRERDEQFVSVRIPLDKGLLGYRVLMIRRGDAQRFANVRTLDAFRGMSLGQGFDWEDTHVLRAAGFDVNAASAYTALLDMLVGERFDGFPRGIYEIDNEMDFYSARGERRIAAEETLLLHYKSTRIVYVSKANAALAARIEAGLRTAVADGSFDALFFSDPIIAKALRRADFAHRRVFELRNPRLSPDFPVNDAALWYQPTAVDLRSHSAVTNKIQH